jgi:hypothetical protein
MSKKKKKNIESKLHHDNVQNFNFKYMNCLSIKTKKKEKKKGNNNKVAI